MKDEEKTKEQLINELAEMRQQIAKLEKAETERKWAERAVQGAQEYAESIIETVHDPLVMLDADMRVVSANRSFYKTFKMKPEEAEGQLLYELNGRQWDIPRLRELLEQILPENTVFDDFEIKHDFPVIGRRAMLLNARRIHSEANKTQLILLAIEDVTERKEMQERLARQERLAVLGQLAGGVGHELRNPLGVIKNSAYFLNMTLTEADEKTKKHLALIDRETEKADKIISDLLDFSRLKSPNRSSVKINRLIRQTLADFPTPPEVRVTCRLASHLPPLLLDQTQIGQVFANIVSNALEAMPQGGRLRVETKMEDDSVMVSFTDTGGGIPKENLEKIFQPLFTTKVKGIGLGLAISKKLVEAHGGKIWAESNGERGSTFHVNLPLPEEEA